MSDKLNEVKAGQASPHLRPPIRTNEITTAYEPFSKQLWKEDEEGFMGEDYEPIFSDEPPSPTTIIS